MLLLLLTCPVWHLTAQHNKKILEELRTPDSKQVLVVAHRGDWRNAPENSLQAIKNCIEMGVDIVEVDVAKTSDGHLVLLHDETLDRTTTGKGLIGNMSLDSVRKLYLKDGLGIKTKHRIPTLEEVLLLIKGKIMINLDKSYPYFRQVYELLIKTETLDHAIFKGKYPYEKVKKDLDGYLNKIIFMPIVDLNNATSQSIIETYQNQMKPVAFEFTYASDSLKIINSFPDIIKKGSRIWNNSLWESQNGGHDDERAVFDKEGSYGWQITHGITIIQTDRPGMLLAYLRKKGLHK